MSPNEVAPLGGSEVTHVRPDDVQALDLEAIQDEPEQALIARGAAYARAYAAVEKAPTILAMNLATVLFAIRRQHRDLLGRSHEYRQVANDVYRRSGLADKDQLTRLQANARYHMGNLLRRQLTPRELKALELNEASPLERQQDRRATDSAILRATKVSAEVAASTPKTTKAAKKAKGKTENRVPEQASGPGLVVKATADHLRLAGVAANLVGQLDTTVIDEHMTDGQRAKLDEELAAIESAARKLRRHLKRARSEG